MKWRKSFSWLFACLIFGYVLTLAGFLLYLIDAPRLFNLVILSIGHLLVWLLTAMLYVVNALIALLQFAGLAL